MDADADGPPQLECLKLGEIDRNPFCKHGPTIIFKNQKKSFYACSACRDRKECNFYAEYSDNKQFSTEKLDFWFQIYQQFQTAYLESHKIRDKARKTNESKRSYCQTCFRFVLNGQDEKAHLNHKFLRRVSDQMMERPILDIVEPLVSNTSNAQFIFDQKSARFILDHISEFSYDSVLCIGCPSIFERIADLDVNRLLLDIDERFAQFYDETKFIKFNMFNYHFFSHKPEYLKFLNKSQKLLVVIDPPYGGIVQLIANTIGMIRNDAPLRCSYLKTLMHLSWVMDRFNHKRGPNLHLFYSGLGDNISIFLIYPYFIRNWIENWLPDFKMLDYKVGYRNQKKFSSDQSVKKGSPARIFTNIPLKSIQLPADQGYKYCGICEKFTFDENIHCESCGTCPSRDGGFYKHCSICNRCVKASYKHCDGCSSCHLETKCLKRPVWTDAQSNKCFKRRKT